MRNDTGISILIRTSNSERPLRTLLNKLIISPHDEIIVVDTRSKDGTISLAKKAGARVIQNEKPFNYSSTLNLGFQAAKNEQVLVLSAHCIPASRDFLEHFRKAFQQLPKRWAAVYGTQVFSQKQYDRSEKVFEVYKGSEIMTRIVSGGNVNALYSKRAWRRHKFDESLKTAEDLEWKNWASQTELVFARAGEACVLYRHPGGPAYRFKKAYNETLIVAVHHPISLLN